MSERLTLEPPRLVLVVVTGTPGVGKTDFARSLSEVINPCQIVSKDDIASRYAYPYRNEADYTNTYRQRIYTQLYREVDYLLSLGSVIVDAPHRFEILKLGWEKEYTRIAYLHDVPVFCLRLVTSEKILRQRLLERNSPLDVDKVTLEGWARFIQEQPIHVNTIPDDCGCIIDNSGPLSATVSQALAFITR